MSVFRFGVFDCVPATKSSKPGVADGTSAPQHIVSGVLCVIKPNFVGSAAESASRAGDHKAFQDALRCLAPALQGERLVLPLTSRQIIPICSCAIRFSVDNHERRGPFILQK